MQNKQPSDYPLISIRPSFKLSKWLTRKAKEHEDPDRRTVSYFIKTILNGLMEKEENK